MEAAAPADSPTQRQIHLLDYWQVIVKRRWAIYSALLLVTGLVTLGSFLVRPQYTATAQLQIEKYSPNVLPFQDVMASYADFRDDFYETQSRVIASRSVARSVARRLELLRHPLYAPFVDKARAAGYTPEELELLVTDMVQAGMQVRLIRNSRLVSVSYVSPEAELSARVANAIAEAYMEFNAATAYNTTEQATQSMLRQIDTLRDEISSRERKLQEYARAQDIIPLDDSQDITTQQLTDLNVAYTRAQTDRIQKEARYAALRETPAESQPELMSNDLLQTLIAKHAELERQHAQMAERFKPDWPAMARLKTELEKTRTRLDDEKADLYARLLGAAREQYEGALGEERALAVALDLQKKHAQEAGLRSIEYNNLKSEVENRRKTLEALVKRQAETGATAGMMDQPLSNIRIVDRAEVPRFPSSPRRLLNFLLSVVAGLGLGIGLAFFFDYMDNSVSTSEEVCRAAGMACIGVIPAHDEPARSLRVVRGKAAPADDSRPEIDLATLRDTRSVVSEAFRELRTALMVSSPGRPPRLLLVTSSQPREGKTSTALNLAITLSQLGRRILVVDADLRRPRLHKALGLSGSSGLSNLLSGGGDLAAMVQATGASGVSILPSGPAPPNPAELLDSAEFAELTRHLASESGYDHVIFDSPPILGVADAAIMAGRMDGVILVVQAGSTPRESVRRAAEKLRLVGSRVLGALLNRADRFGEGYYRSYHAYYGEPDARGAQQADEASADDLAAEAGPPLAAPTRLRRGVRSMADRRIRPDN